MNGRCRSGFLILLVLASAVPVSAQAGVQAEPTANSVSVETLAVGTPFETKIIVRTADRPGPVVLLTGGMHGNEPAGAAAAEQIAQWQLVAGTLIVIPQTNRPALAVGRRYTPDVEAVVRNLNRNFIVKDTAVEPRGLMAELIWHVVRESGVDWVVDLHEGYDFTRVNSRSVGSSVIADSSAVSVRLAASMIAAVDAEITDPSRKFMRRGPPVRGSLARAFADTTQGHGLIVETTFKDQSLAVRCRQHRLMVATLLSELGLVESASVAEEFVPATERDSVNVALFDDSGVSGKGIPALTEIFSKHADVTVDRVCAADIRAGALSQFDVLCCSGGSGSRQAGALQRSGAAEVREFVRTGGSYVGICAGSYLACSGFEWGLGILDAKTRSNRWRRGRGVLQVQFTAAGQARLGVGAERLAVLYANGPILEPHGQPGIPDFETWAAYEEEVSENGSPPGIMIGSPAIVHGKFGTGQVFCIGPHPEQTDGASQVIDGLLNLCRDHSPIHPVGSGF